MRKRRGHGEGSIWQRADGRWEGRIDLGWQDGKRVRRSVYGDTQADVVEQLRRMRGARAVGLPLADERLRVGVWLDRWLAGLPRDLSTNTLDNYAWAVRVHLQPALGHKILTQLTPHDVALFLRKTAEDGLSKSTRMRLRSVLSMAIREAEIEGIVVRNVASLVRNPATPPVPGRTLTPPQAKSLLAAAEGDPLEIALRLGLLLGLRPGEVLGLPWSNVDFEARVVRVHQSLKREATGLRIGPPKTPRSRRSIALPDVVVGSLRAHEADQTQLRVAAGAAWQEHGLVVTSAIGTPVDPSNYRRAFARVCRVAELGHWHPNELRHSFVSLLHAAGVPLERIADIVGHDGTRMTSGVYRHLVDPVITHAVEPIDRLFGDGGGAEIG
jgi:integrase